MATDRSPEAPVRVFAVSHASGATSAFGAWPALLGPEVDVCPVQLPGQERHAGEPIPEGIDALIGDLATALVPHLDRPFVFFGHDMGALVAFELARALRRGQGPMPNAIIVSSAPPPRAALADSRHGDEAPLDMEIVAVGGLSEAGIGHEDLTGWSVHTQGRFRVEQLPGNPASLIGAQRPVTQLVASVCREVARATEQKRRHAEILADMRRELDAMDDELVAVLTRRLHHCDRIAEIKREHGIPMMQPHRVELVKQRCSERAHKAGIDPQFVIDLYTRIIEETCRRETQIIDDEIEQ